MGRSYFFVIFVTFHIIVTNEASVIDLNPKRVAYIEESAKLVKSYINESANPCSDFTSYICGGPEVTTELTLDDMVRNRLVDRNHVKEFFDKYETDIKNISDDEEKLHDFLQSCKTQNWKKPIDVLKENTFLRIFKTWPIFDLNWSVEKFDIVQLLGELRRYNFDIGLNVWIKRNFKRDVLGIFPVAIYEKFLMYTSSREAMMKDLGIDNPEMISTINSDTVSFVNEYSKVIPDDGANKSPEIKITYGEFKKDFPNFDWDRYFHIFSDMVPDDSTEILVANLERIKAAISVLETIEPRKVVNFIFLQFVIRFNQLIENKKYSCYEYAFIIFQSIITRTLIDKHYNDEFREKFLGTMDILLEAVDNDSHLLQISHDNAMKKLNQIINEEFLSSSTNLNKRLKGWEVDTDSFYANAISYYPRMEKEEMQYFLKTKGMEDKILNVNFISYLITKYLFDIEKKPAALQYDSIATPVIIEVIDWLFADGSNDLRDGFSEDKKEQFMILRNSSVGAPYFLQSNQYYLELYQKWAQKNQNIIEKEDQLLSSYGLNSMKVLFSAMRDVCPWHKLISDNAKELIAQRLADSEAFVKEYDCPSGDAINETE